MIAHASFLGPVVHVGFGNWQRQPTGCARTSDHAAPTFVWSRDLSLEMFPAPLRPQGESSSMHLDSIELSNGVEAQPIFKLLELRASELVHSFAKVRDASS